MVLDEYTSLSRGKYGENDTAPIKDHFGLMAIAHVSKLFRTFPLARIVNIAIQNVPDFFFFKVMHTRGQNRQIPVFFSLFLGQKWPTLGTVRRGRTCFFPHFFCCVVVSTPGIDSMQIFVVIGVDFTSIWQPDAFFCPFWDKNRGRKKGKKEKKVGKKKN